MTDYSIMAFDYGDKRIGVAIANSLARFARPLTTLKNDDTVFTRIGELIKENNVREIAVGLPRNMKGEETAQSQACRDFAQKLAENTAIKVKLVDESLSSVLSEERLNKSSQTYNKGEIDMHAASLVLQEYLEQ